MRHMKTLISTYFVAATLVFAQGGKKNIDFYESIASQKFNQRGHYPEEMIRPPKLPEGPVFQFGNGEPFAPMDKLDTEEEMNAALAGLRKQYGPFLEDLAPAIPEARKRIAVSKMQFRYETAEDRADFNRLVEGKGTWEEVRIPHYQGPQGPATAWYRAEIDIAPDMFASDRLVLHFNGADYYCDAYVNGHHVGSHEGMIDPFEFDCKPYAKPGRNVVLVRLRNDYSMIGSEDWARRWGNKIAASNSPGWDDPMHGWNCCPAGFGLYQDLFLETQSFVSLVDIFPRPLLAQDTVEIWTEVELPDGNRAGDFQLKLSVFGQNFRETVVKDKVQGITVDGGVCLYKAAIKIPKEKLRVWSPDKPWLYQVQVSLLDKSGKKRLDSMKRQFGMRSFVISETSTPKGRMYLNGKEIRLRGTNTMGFLQRDVMTHDWKQLTDDLLLAKLTHMNFIRTTQRSLQEEVYEYADRLGMMMQSDLPLFGYINQKQFGEAISQAGRMERLLRSHPSVILISYLNESMGGRRPHAISRAQYEQLFRAADIFVHHENPDRAVKYVDGDYQGPNAKFPDDHCYNIWYHNHGCNLGWLYRGGWRKIKKGWMYGCGEFGAEGLDSVDLMLRRYPDQWLPPNRDPKADWTPKLMRTDHKNSQTWGMHWKWFETQNKMADWVRLSREHQAWGVQLVASAFRRMPHMNTFAIHLFIDAWPNGWLKTIMDTERHPKRAWFVYRDVLTPLSVDLRADKRSFFSGQKYNLEAWVCNDTHTTPKAELRYQIEMGGKVLASGRTEAKVPAVAQGSQFQGYLPVTAPETDQRTTFTVRMALVDGATGKTLHETSWDFDLYPRLPEHGKGKTLCIVGKPSEASKALAAAFAMKVADAKALNDADVIAVTDLKLYNQLREKVDAAVKNGARCIVLARLPGEPAKIGQSIVKADKAKAFWFVARAKDHPALKGTHHNDFKFWYSSKDHCARMHRIVPFSSPGFRPVLVSNHRSVVAETNDGKGRWIIYQMDLPGKLANPACKVLLDRLLFSSLANGQGQGKTGAP